jgi:hypothetical protein
MTPALSFSCENKKEAIVNKECSQTIRTPRKNPIEVGDRLYIYWKQRVSPEKKDHHKIGEGVVTETYPITMGGHFIEGAILEKETVEEIAEKDGFDSQIEFEKWFDEQYGLDEPFSKPMNFKIIRWEWREDNK